MRLGEDEVARAFHDDLVELALTALPELALGEVQTWSLDSDHSIHRGGCGEIELHDPRTGEEISWRHSLAQELVRGYERWMCCREPVLDAAYELAGRELRVLRRMYQLRATREHWRHHQDHDSYTREIIERVYELQQAVRGVRGAVGAAGRAELAGSRWAAAAAVVRGAREGAGGLAGAEHEGAARACAGMLAGEEVAAQGEAWVWVHASVWSTQLLGILGEERGVSETGMILSGPRDLVEALASGRGAEEGELIVLQERTRGVKEARLVLELLAGRRVSAEALEEARRSAGELLAVV